jgi:recombination protein RecA
MSENGKNTISELETSLRKRYGSMIMRGADLKNINYERVPTGSFALDFVCGGGLPKGRMVELFGPEGSGKTVLSLKTVANVQAMGQRAAWIDYEGGLDILWAAKLGVKTSDLLVARPQLAEEAADILVATVQSREFGIVVLDSVGSMMPADEQDKSMVDDRAKVGGLSGLVTRLVTRTRSSLNTYDEDGGFNETLVILINQVRENLKIMYGNNQQAPGGHALRHLCSIILRLRRGEWIETENDLGLKEKVGHVIHFKADKNHTAPPGRESECCFYFTGPMAGQIDDVESVLRYAAIYNVVSLEGRTYKYEDIKAVGKDSFAQLLREQPKVFEKIKADTRKLALRLS